MSNYLSSLIGFWLLLYCNLHYFTPNITSSYIWLAYHLLSPPFPFELILLNHSPSLWFVFFLFVSALPGKSLHQKKENTHFHCTIVSFDYSRVPESNLHTTYQTKGLFIPLASKILVFLVATLLFILNSLSSLCIVALAFTTKHNPE